MSEDDREYAWGVGFERGERGSQLGQRPVEVSGAMWSVLRTAWTVGRRLFVAKADIAKLEVELAVARGRITELEALQPREEPSPTPLTPGDVEANQAESALRAQRDAYIPGKFYACGMDVYLACRHRGGGWESVVTLFQVTGGSPGFPFNMEHPELHKLVPPTPLKPAAHPVIPGRFG